MEEACYARNAPENSSEKNEQQTGHQVEEMPELPRKPGTTTLLHFILERMLSYHDPGLVQRLQQRLSEQDLQEQVHSLLRILPPRAP